jgi:hypothetical protein
MTIPAEEALDQIANQWGETLAERLQERYGLAKEEARKKVERWFQAHQTAEPAGESGG